MPFFRLNKTLSVDIICVEIKSFVSIVFPQLSVNEGREVFFFNICYFMHCYKKVKLIL